MTDENEKSDEITEDTFLSDFLPRQILLFCEETREDWLSLKEGKKTLQFMRTCEGI